MNAKTAKLVNRYARSLIRNPRSVRKAYYRLPKRQRFATKEEMRQVICDAVRRANDEGYGYYDPSILKD